jgi:hypothetical protein
MVSIGFKNMYDIYVHTFSFISCGIGILELNGIDIVETFRWSRMSTKKMLCW